MTPMNDQTNASGGPPPGGEKPSGFGGFLTFRVLVGVVLGVAVLWAAWAVLGFFEGRKADHVGESEMAALSHGDEEGDDEAFDPGLESEESGPDVPIFGEKTTEHAVESGHGGLPGRDETESEHGVPAAQKPPASIHGAGADHGKPRSHGIAPEDVSSPEQALHGGPATTVHIPKAVGVHLVDATISVLEYELKDRFWGWRRNDLVRFTDNVESIQLGILEVVRRTSVNLMEKMSRHGVSASIDPNLENAMNWLMIKPDKYWLPAAEEKYQASSKELREYAKRLETGKARFYVRTDTLIPLLLAFADLAGSCDENLVKTDEDDGAPVSWFKVDDYFYYSKGMAIAMGKILHAVREDFSSVLEARQGVDLLNRAIHACHVAAELDPWLVTDAPLDGILANHRANMASEISHLRYFLNALAKAIAT
jgi:hypothetical protein